MLPTSQANSKEEIKILKENVSTTSSFSHDSSVLSSRNSNGWVLVIAPCGERYFLNTNNYNSESAFISAVDYFSEVKCDGQKGVSFVTGDRDWF